MTDGTSTLVRNRACPGEGVEYERIRSCGRNKRRQILMTDTEKAEDTTMNELSKHDDDLRAPLPWIHTR
jgi:hypothetical protein